MRLLKIKFYDTEKTSVVRLPDDFAGVADIGYGDRIVVKTDRGEELVKVLSICEVDDELMERKGVSQEQFPLFLRVAREFDVEDFEKNRTFCMDAAGVCTKMIKELGLPMKLVRVYTTLHMERIVFYFTAEGRVDFRQLVRKLAAHFKTRIELRQIGVRDEVKMMGAVGVCGMECCCKLYMECFYPVSLNMARIQGLPPSPAKLSGVCGRLMCCLKYEEKLYAVREKLPDVGEEVVTVRGTGVVSDVDVVKQKLVVEFPSGEKSSFDIRDFISEEEYARYVMGFSQHGDDRFDCFVRTEGEPETEEDIQEQT